MDEPSRPRRGRAAVLVVAALAVLVAIVATQATGNGDDGHRPPDQASPGPAGQPPDRPLALGVVGDLTWGIRAAHVDRSVRVLRRAGAGWVRANVNWADVERVRKGRYDRRVLRRLDYAVKAMRRARIKILMPISDGVPYWASGDPAKRVVRGERDWRRRHPPRDVRDYADFVRFVVKRYRPHGVRVYEIWNEPNHDGFWEPEPDAAEYAQLLRAGHGAVKATDPGARVVLGGLSTSDYDYLAELYEAGAGRHFDVVAIHPYTGGAPPKRCWRRGDGRLDPDAFCAIREVRKTMEANGDAAKPIWLTEVGWTTTSQGGGVSRRRQRDYLRQSVAIVRDRMPYVEAYFWYSLRNNYWENGADTFEGQFGLLEHDFDAKPALGGFADIARGR